MAQVSIGQVENLADLVRGLSSVRESLDSACRQQVAIAESKCAETDEETKNSRSMLERVVQQEQVAQRAVEDAQQIMETCQNALSAARSALSACADQPRYDDEDSPDCSSEESGVADAESAVEQAQAELEQSQADFELAKENRQAMERRVECAKQALSMAKQVLEQSRTECAVRLVAVSQSVDLATGRLTAAQQALYAYLATTPSAAQFHSWLYWSPAQHGGPITPDILSDRMNLSAGQLTLFQEYLYNRDSTYRRMVDNHRREWAEAKGDAERNIVARKVGSNMCSQFTEHIVRHALAPLGGGIESQRRTFVGDNGRYTKTDLLIKDLRVPVILGRGKSMGAPVGGSMAFEVKCGKANYIYKEKEHMEFQAEGHKQSDAHCTICSRDINDLAPEKEKELREALREAGSPLVGMLPRKNDIDQSCLVFIRQDEEEKL